MPTAGPYGITQFDAAGAINAYQQGQENRIRSLILQKQVEAQDRATEREAGVQKAVSAYVKSQSPTNAGSDAAPQPATAAPTPSKAADPLAPLPDAPAAPQATSAAAQPAPESRDQLINSLMVIDADTAMKYSDMFAKMDANKLAQFKQTNDHIIQVAGGLLQLPLAQRPAAIQQAAPELQQLGFTPDQISNFDPSDQNLRHLVAGHMDADKIAQYSMPDMKVVGTSLVDANNPGAGPAYTAPTDLKTIMVRNADGSETPYSFDPSTGKASQLRDGVGAADADVSGAAAGGFDNAVNLVLKHEGGYNPSDMNGAPVNFGINQGANPGVDVKNMTQDQAKQVYHDKYWVPSGAEKLPANLQAPYFDVYIRNPAVAKRALAQSGGDGAKFMGLATEYFQKLAKTDKGSKYGSAWAARDAENLAIATGKGPSGEGAPITGKPLATNADDEETAKFIGGQVALGQPMPPLGMGKQAADMRRQILAEATKQWRQMGISPGEANVIAAQNKSGLAELAKIAQMKAQVQTAENTANSNATQVLDLLGSAGTTGSPIFNAWQQAGRRATGNSKVSALDVAVKTLSTEYARVMSGGGTMALSDSARQEADALIHTSMTPDQFRSTIKQMKIDMENRTKGIEQERQATLQQIRSGGQGQKEEWLTTPSGIRYRKVG